MPSDADKTVFVVGDLPPTLTDMRILDALAEIAPDISVRDLLLALARSIHSHAYRAGYIPGFAGSEGDAWAKVHARIVDAACFTCTEEATLADVLNRPI